MEIELPSWLSEDDWNDFLEFRKTELKKPMGPIAQKRMLNRLREMKEAGEDISQALERSMVNGWQDVWPVPPEQKQSRAQAHQDAHKEELPEISDEERERNLEYLRNEIPKVFNINGGRK